MSVLQSMIRWLMPDESRFYDHIVTVAETSLKAAKIFAELPDTQGREAQLAIVDRVKKTEQEGDAALRDISAALDATFVTPIDREDLYHLASALETISDIISATAMQLYVHHMETLPAGTRELSDLLLKSTEQVVEAVRLLRLGTQPEEIRAACRALDQLEFEADQRFRTRLGALFETERDAITLIKHKEFLEGLENSIDKCAHVGTTLQAILIKNG